MLYCAVKVPGNARTEDIFITTRHRKGSASTASSFSNTSTITAPLSPTSPTASEYDSSDTVTCPDDAVSSPRTDPSNGAQLKEENVVSSDKETGDTDFQTQENAASKNTIEDILNYGPNQDSETNVIYFSEPGIVDHGPSISSGGFKGDMVAMDEVNVLYCHHQKKSRKASKKESRCVEKKDEENSVNELMEQRTELDHSGGVADQDRDEKQEKQERLETG